MESIVTYVLGNLTEDLDHQEIADLFLGSLPTNTTNADIVWIVALFLGAISDNRADRELAIRVSGDIEGFITEFCDSSAEEVFSPAWGDHDTIQ